MSGASQKTKMPKRIYETRPTYDLTEDLQQRVDRHGLADVVAQVRNEGYAYMRNPESGAFVQRLRETILRITKAEGSLGSDMMLPKDPVFVDAVVNPGVLTMVEIIVGKGALLCQLAGSVKQKTNQDFDGIGGLHADQDWMPAPFPEHNQLLTFCWSLDEASGPGGSTRIVPRSHLLRRHPNARETEEESGVIATECPAGSIIIWDGCTWHSGFAPRTIAGERVVLHMTFCRLSVRPVENYDFLDDAWLADKPYALRVLLGREDFLSSQHGAHVHGEKLIRTMNWGKS